MASGTPGTCSIHGLATRPDGTCVRCREEQHRSGARKVIIGAAVFFGIAVAGLGVFWVMHEPETEKITAPTLKVPEVETAGKDEPAVAAHDQRATPSNTQDPWAESRKEAGAAPAASAETQDEEKEREKKIEAAMKKVSVTVYYTRTCPTCQKALAFLKFKKIPHAARDIEASESARRRWKFLSSSTSVPKFDIGGTVLDGFSQSAVMDAIRDAAEKRVDQGRY